MNRTEAADDDETAQAPLRRWLDKIMIGAIGIVFVLFGVVYGAICGDMNKLDSIQRANVERIGKAEQRVVDVDRRLERIENKIDLLLTGGGHK